MDSTALFLVIDDDPDLLEGMARILRRDGHQVITASTGAEGIRLAVEQQPDIAVVDAVLPDMNGLEVCQHIQASLQPGVIDTILISSTQTAAEYYVKGYHAGVSEYISRPLPNAEFLARVNARLKEKNTRDSLKLDREKAREVSDREKLHRIDLEEELQTIFFQAPIALFLTDGDARVLKANPALAKIFGGDVDSKIGESCGVAFDCSRNADHTEGCGFGPFCAACGVRSAITDTFSTGQFHTELEACLRCMQEDRIVRFSTSLVVVSGEKRVFVCMEDVTERKASEIALYKNEEFFRRTFDQSPIGAAIISLDYTFLNVNDELCTMTGYQSSELFSQHFSVITCAEDLSFYLKQAEDLVEGLIDSYEMDKPLVHKSGKKIWVRLSVRLIRDNEGNPMYFLPMMIEIDDRKRMEEEKDIQLELFSIIGKQNDLHKMLESVLFFFKTWSGVDAIAIRLKQGKMFPYYASIGFPEEFIRTAKSVFTTDDKGTRFSCGEDEQHLECMCDLVINGRHDASRSFFTARGSFCSNNTSLFMTRHDTPHMYHGMPNHCNAAGYESVLLVPLQVGENTLGLIQLNHKEANRFSSEFVSLMERLAGHIAVAIAQQLAEQNLKIKQAELEEMNAALKVLLRNREEDLLEHDRGILINVHQLVLPCIERLKLGALDTQQKSQLNVLESNLKTITSPFAKNLSSIKSALTPSLVQVADMIRKGLTNKEIARLQGISVKSVETYRKRIRARLNLQNSKINLRAHLMSMEQWDN
ncbi:PAS domain S-box protein [Desulfogranum marinum]|uniref:PAS domain S-box protein n=1 Tax=Desulfogranum marinum TaxID=453220 RepID=UPI0019638188|nr:PAS domain S-box protein [Desulfogranum marinum]MBM9512187.1 PAS domain S-box protein [Desulfogranum marinum]